MDQLSTGFLVNIYKNGGWGTYKRIVIQGVINNNIVKNPELKIISTNRFVIYKHVGYSLLYCCSYN